MKLYYATGACSMASRIVLNELGASAEFEKVDLKTKLTDSGEDFRQINPLGYVPALELGDGRTLIENNAILPFLAAQKPGTLAPQNDPFAEAKLQQWLGFLSSELHKSVGIFFGNPEGEAREAALTKLGTRLDYLEQHLGNGRPYLLGDSFSVADAYAFVILSWTGNFGIPLSDRSNVHAYFERVRSRPAVQQALEQEGLLEQAA
jgi:glutathione S-transferase